MNVITVDGPAGVGKGTLAVKPAQHFDFACLDTGLIYRAVALKCIDWKVSPEKAAVSIVPVDLNNSYLRSEVVGEKASEIAAIPQVRELLFQWQRNFCMYPPHGKAGSVLDGRDTGTVICPEASAKIFLIATPEIRAERRQKELQGWGQDAIYDTILRGIQERDVRDSTRAVAPLVPAFDAFVIDTSFKTIQEVFDDAAGWVNQCFAVLRASLVS